MPLDLIVVHFRRSNTSPIIESTQEDEFSIYKISFMWYGFMGAMMVYIVAIPVSYLTGGVDLDQFDTKLLAPIARSFLPKKMRHIELPVKAPNGLSLPTDWIRRDSEPKTEQEKELLKK